MSDQTTRARWARTSQEARKRARGRSGDVTGSPGDVLIIAGGNGKTCGPVSREEVQYPTATPQGLLDGLTFGMFPDARRRFDSWIWRKIVSKDVDEVLKLFICSLVVTYGSS